MPYRVDACSALPWRAVGPTILTGLVWGGIGVRVCGIACSHGGDSLGLTCDVGESSLQGWAGGRASQAGGVGAILAEGKHLKPSVPPNVEGDPL